MQQVQMIAAILFLVVGLSAAFYLQSIDRLLKVRGARIHSGEQRGERVAAAMNAQKLKMTRMRHANMRRKKNGIRSCKHPGSRVIEYSAVTR
jgi:hypothetical protein